ncbi:MAG: hypothetical protein ACRD0J_04130 [Acidimicrobiales bacterium]
MTGPDRWVRGALGALVVLGLVGSGVLIAFPPRPQAQTPPASPPHIGRPALLWPTPSTYHPAGDSPVQVATAAVMATGALTPRHPMGKGEARARALPAISVSGLGDRRPSLTDAQVADHMRESVRIVEVALQPEGPARARVWVLAEARMTRPGRPATEVPSPWVVDLVRLRGRWVVSGMGEG